MKAPEFCLICGKGSWRGGHCGVGDEMKDGLRIFFSCGSSMSVENLSDGAYSILVKNCLTGTEWEGKER